MTTFVTTISWFFPILLLIIFIYIYLLSSVMSDDDNIAVFEFYASLFGALLTNIILFFVIDFDKITFTLSFILNILFIIVIYYVINVKLYIFNTIPKNVPLMQGILIKLSKSYNKLPFSKKEEKPVEEKQK